jgi:chromosome segregation ATPase
MERKVSEISMLEIDEVRNAVANLQIDAYQLNQKIERLEEKLEILELKLNEILDVIGKTNVY